MSRLKIISDRRTCSFENYFKKHSDRSLAPDTENKRKLRLPECLWIRIFEYACPCGAFTKLTKKLKKLILEQTISVHCHQINYGKTKRTKSFCYFSSPNSLTPLGLGVQSFDYMKIVTIKQFNSVQHKFSKALFQQDCLFSKYVPERREPQLHLTKNCFLDIATRTNRRAIRKRCNRRCWHKNKFANWIHEFETEECFDPPAEYVGVLNLNLNPALRVSKNYKRTLNVVHEDLLLSGRSWARRYMFEICQFVIEIDQLVSEADHLERILAVSDHWSNGPAADVVLLVKVFKLGQAVAAYNSNVSKFILKPNQEWMSPGKISKQSAYDHPYAFDKRLLWSFDWKFNVETVFNSLSKYLCFLFRCMKRLRNREIKAYMIDHTSQIYFATHRNPGKAYIGLYDQLDEVAELIKEVPLLMTNEYIWLDLQSPTLRVISHFPARTARF